MSFKKKLKSAGTILDLRETKENTTYHMQPLLDSQFFLKGAIKTFGEQLRKF